MLAKFCFSERLKRKSLRYGRPAESTIILKEVRSISVPLFCEPELAHILIAIAHKRMDDLK